MIPPKIKIIFPLTYKEPGLMILSFSFSVTKLMVFHWFFSISNTSTSFTKSKGFGPSAKAAAFSLFPPNKNRYLSLKVQALKAYLELGRFGNKIHSSFSIEYLSMLFKVQRFP